MDTIITYDEARAVLPRPPSVSPRPNFTNIRALRAYFVKGLKRLPCPQSTVMGWAGMVMAAVLYRMHSANDFQVPAHPGEAPSFPTHRRVQRPEQVTIERKFARQNNYHTSYINIYRACMDILFELVPEEFQVSNVAGQSGWNATMSIRDIFDQLANTYGRPTPQVLFENTARMHQPYNGSDPPETLFRRLDECQEIALLGRTAFSPEQLLLTARHLIEATGRYTLEFQEWDRKPDADKTYTNLRTFIQTAYTNRYGNASGTTGAAGYGNAFNVMASEEGTEDDDIIDELTEQVAALATQGQQHAANANANVESLSAAMNQLHQQQQQLLALFATQQQQQQHQQFLAANQAQQQQPVLPMWNPQAAFALPQNMAPAQWQGGQRAPANGRGRGRGGRGRGNGGRGGRGGGAPVYDTGAQGHYQRPPQQQQWYCPPAGGGAVPPPPGFMPNNRGAPNPIKRFANWKMCQSCGFDVDHDSPQCPRKKPGHNDAVNRSNWAQYEAMGYVICKKGIHKTQFPAQGIS